MLLGLIILFWLNLLEILKCLSSIFVSWSAFSLARKKPIVSGQLRRGRFSAFSELPDLSLFVVVECLFIAICLISMAVSLFSWFAWCWVLLEYYPTLSFDNSFNKVSYFDVSSPPTPVAFNKVSYSEVSSPPTPVAFSSFRTWD